MDTDSGVPTSIPKCIFDGIFRDPFTVSEYLINGYVNKFSVAMRKILAQSIALESLTIRDTVCG